MVPAATLAHVSRVLAPGGFLLLHECLDATRALFWGLAEQCWRHADARDYSAWCTFARWEALLDAAGFEQVRPAFLQGGLPACGLLLFGRT